MATTTTTNIALVKPDYSEAADVQVLNGNADKIDAAFGVAYNAFGIVVNGNKAALSAATGQFVILKNSTISGRSDGLYTAAKPIPANTAINNTYLTAVTGGGLNALLGQIPEQLIHMGTENDYPLSTEQDAYQLGVTLMRTLSTTEYPYTYGTVVTIRCANARCVQFSFGNSPNSYKLRTADSNGWSAWKTYSGS